MPKCSICKKNYEFPDGLTFVHIDGRVLHFCSSKCRKNYKLERRKMRWVVKQKSIDKIGGAEEETAKAEKPAERKEEKKADVKSAEPMQKPKEEKAEKKKEEKAEEKK